MVTGNPVDEDLRRSLDNQAAAPNAHERLTSRTTRMVGPKRLTGDDSEGQGGLTQPGHEKSNSLEKWIVFKASKAPCVTKTSLSCQFRSSSSIIPAIRFPSIFFPNSGKLAPWQSPAARVW